MADEKALAEEQSYLDTARERREHHRETIASAAAMTATRGHASGLRAYAKSVDELLGEPDEPAAVGRFDNEDGETYYVGKCTIWGEDTDDILVIDWRRDAITAPFYMASLGDPHGLVRKRDFISDRTKLIDFREIIFDHLASEIAALSDQSVVSDRLLDELARGRTGEMADIVATIQAAQFDVIRADADQLLVIQGGPGTGKTAVGLHRLSWLLFTRQDQLRPEAVAVIGPSRPFIRYVQAVLPALGDIHVPHLELGSLLVQRVAVDRTDPPAAARLKGSTKMKLLLERALASRISVPDDGLALRTGTSTARWSTDALTAEVDKRRTVSYNAGRQSLRDWLRADAQRQGASPAADELDRLLERVWPSLTAAQFVQELYGSDTRLLRAAGNEFVGTEIELLYRKAADRVTEERWSPSDIAVLDYAQNLLDPGRAKRYEHLVVDEVQDLSPMELEMLARRCPSGSITALGDLAQSTGAWARSSWDDVVQVLAGDNRSSIVDLEHGYRVPRPIFAFASTLIPHMNTPVRPPVAVRDGAEPDFVLSAPEQLAGHLVDAARDYAARGLLVGIVCPSSRRSDVIHELQRAGVQYTDARDGALGSTITLLTPATAKGLEFDAVVVADPAGFLDEDPEGLRLLYVALTRTTNRLTVVHTGSVLPVEGTRGVHAASRPDEQVPPSTAAGTDGLLDAVVVALRDQISSLVRADQRELVVRRLLELLEEEDPDSRVNGAEGP